VPAQLRETCVAFVLAGQQQAKPGSASATKPGAAAQPVAPAAAPTVCTVEPLLLTGLDTVCHRAVVLAYRAAVVAVQANLAQASIAALKQELYGCLTHEQQWGRAWEAMLQDLDTV
jgi:hypothetical protein